ncbi:MAG: hypothetical protein IJL92_08015 [Thermoguttaceae bacterium]|nr:hypothetical protein [Thermoguttaceae bacterium]
MKLRSNSVRRLFSGLCAASLFIANSPLLLAADKDEAPASDPVWVLSYAAFILFAGSVIMIALFFSKRRDTLLDMEEQKKVSKICADRVSKRRKEQQRAKMMAAKKRR